LIASQIAKRLNRKVNEINSLFKESKNTIFPKKVIVKLYSKNNKQRVIWYPSDEMCYEVRISIEESSDEETWIRGKIFQFETIKTR
jgi:ribosomal protein L35AE/L33A